MSYLNTEALLEVALINCCETLSRPLSGRFDSWDDNLATANQLPYRALNKSEENQDDWLTRGGGPNISTDNSHPAS